jgi:enoyl-CoA hydratase/carnithine racemase
MPGWRFGIALGTRRLVGRVGADSARSILSASRMFDAAEAQAIGFATSLAPQEEWPGVIEAAVARSALLDPVSQTMLLNLTAPDTRAADLAALVESAGRPGLKLRIEQYRAAEKAARARK